MAENQAIFWLEDEKGNRVPLERMTRAQCEAVIQAMAAELDYWRRLDDLVHAVMEREDASGAPLQ